MESLRKIDPLVFDEDVADNFIKFEREWKVYLAAALSEKTKKIQSYNYTAKSSCGRCYC